MKGCERDIVKEISPYGNKIAYLALSRFHDTSVCPALGFPINAIIINVPRTLHEEGL